MNHCAIIANRHGVPTYRVRRPAPAQSQGTALVYTLEVNIGNERFSTWRAIHDYRSAKAAIQAALRGVDY